MKATGNLFVQAGLALTRLRRYASPNRAREFFLTLGFDLPQGPLNAALTPLLQELNSLDAALNSAVIVDEPETLAPKLLNTILALDVFAGDVSAVSPGLNTSTLKRALLDYLVVRQIEVRSKPGYAFLKLLGLLDEGVDLSTGKAHCVLHWDRFSRCLFSPGDIAKIAYGWGANFDLGKALLNLDGIRRALGLAGGIYPQKPALSALVGNTAADAREFHLPILQDGLDSATFRQLGLTILAVESGSAGGALAFFPYGIGNVDAGFSVCERGELVLQSTTDLRGIGFALQPPATAKAVFGISGSIDTEIRVSEVSTKSDEHVVVGTTHGTRLTIKGLGARFFLSGNSDTLDLGVLGSIERLRFVLEAGDGDGFLQKVLSGVRADTHTDMAVGVSLKDGFTFRGGSKLVIDIGAHADVGPVRINGLRFALMPSTDGVGLQAGAHLTFEFGPLQAVAENVGLQASLRFTPGNLGPADIRIDFMPPNGVGLSLDAGGFKGGGFLRFEPATAEYAGALELDFHGLFSVKAIAIINTRMPDGQAGYSLLILIASEFVPVQLSFGFTLNGVGGLIGLNRTIVVNALVEGIRTNAVKSILFPQDVVANITRIISDLKQFFPPEDDHFVVGPMAKLGWGTPSIITVELGLLLDLPRPMITIIGVLRAMLPAEDAPILRLQVNFIGVLDFERGYLFFRADLYDSRLLIYSITGSMAFLVSWGEQKTFALSVGGFHPDFRDVPTIPALPSGFRTMSRIGLSLLSDDNPRLKVESYFAVTSNTVQFGARLELYAGVGSLNVYGFLGYDVLFQFEPFYFIAKMYGGLALREGVDVIAGINITAQLSGPNPWDARGTATLTILFFDIDVDFHVTWGDPPPAVANQTEDLLALLKREYADTRNWRADLPPDNHLHVTLRKLEPSKTNEPLVIHPAGVVTFSERALPLDGYVIDKFGTRKPLADNRFTLSNANANGLPIPADFLGVREEFAPAQFSVLSDGEKLSRRSFERLPSGFSLTGTADLKSTLPVIRDVEYELSYLKRKPVRTEFKTKVRPMLRVHERLVRGSAVRQSVLARQQVRVSMNAPPPVSLPAEEFTIASTSDLKAYAAEGGLTRRFNTQAEAYQHQQNLIRRNPSLAGQIQVVSQYELAA
jgi:hypothetical protein